MKKPWSIRSNYHKNGECVRCPYCGCKGFDENVIDRIDGYMTEPCEIETRCSDCHEIVGYWTYGYYDPCFKFNDRSWEMFWVRLNYKIRGLSTP